MITERFSNPHRRMLNAAIIPRTAPPVWADVVAVIPGIDFSFELRLVHSGLLVYRAGGPSGHLLLCFDIGVLHLIGKGLAGQRARKPSDPHQ